MTTELTKALEACPFCGADPQDARHIEYGRWAVTCRCGASGASANTGPNATDAAKIKAYNDARTAWNTRALTQRPAAQEVGVLERCAQWCDEQARSDWWGRKASDMVRAFASLPAPQQATSHVETDWISNVIRDVSELPDRSSPDDEPDMMLVTAAELRSILETHAPQQATPDQFADASKMVSPVALRSVRLTRDTAGMCVVRVNGRVAIRDNGDIIDHIATLEWFADTQQATPTTSGNILTDAFNEVQALKQQATPEPVGEQAIDIKAAAGKLMGWPLPKDFSPDNGIRFTPPSFGWPTGTNLLNVQQAEEMLAYVLEGVAHPAPVVPEGLDEDQLHTVALAADLLEHYAAYINEVKPDDIERHPYLPEIELTAADLRVLSKRGGDA